MPALTEFKGSEDVIEVSRAVASLLDVVEELAQGLAAGQEPDPDWAELVANVFRVHRHELGVERMR